MQGNYMLNSGKPSKMISQGMLLYLNGILGIFILKADLVRPIVGIGSGAGGGGGCRGGGLSFFHGRRRGRGGRVGQGHRGGHCGHGGRDIAYQVVRVDPVLVVDEAVDKVGGVGVLVQEDADAVAVTLRNP